MLRGEARSRRAAAASRSTQTAWGAKPPLAKGILYFPCHFLLLPRPSSMARSARRGVSRSRIRGGLFDWSLQQLVSSIGRENRLGLCCRGCSHQTETRTPAMHGQLLGPSLAGVQATSGRCHLFDTGRSWPVAAANRGRVVNRPSVTICKWPVLAGPCPISRITPHRRIRHLGSSSTGASASSKTSSV